MNRITVLSDPAGEQMRDAVIEWLREGGYIIKLPFQYRCDYLFSTVGARSYLTYGFSDFVIIFTPSGADAAYASNRHSAVRAINCSESDTARIARETFNANTLCLGVDIISLEEAKDIIRTFLSTSFIEDKRNLENLLDADNIPNILNR